MLQTWQPQGAGVNQICTLLAEFQNPGSDQGQILAQLEQCRTFPDFNNYLAFIFAQGDPYPIEVRQSAGLLLKNNLREQYGSTSEDFRSYIKLALLHAIGHPRKEIRHTVGTTIGTVVAASGLASWPELVAVMGQCLESNDRAQLEGALDALYKVCEDTPAQLEVTVPGLPDKPSNIFVPRLLALFSCSHQEAKCLAVACLNLLAGNMPAALASSIDQYLQGLFSLAYDDSPSVKKAVCTGLVQMLHLQADRLEPHMCDIIEYMLKSTQESDEGVALESCEFWSAFCEAQINPQMLRPFLPRLIPVLLKNMVYDEYDEEVTEAEMADEELNAVGHNNTHDHEIKPFIHRSRGSMGEEEDTDDGEEVGKWNLRKCSAAGLDVLSTVFQDELLPIVTPIVQARLQDPDWRARESAILALGAISEGCARGLMPFLQDMVGMLLPMLDDPRPLVRSITCWALSRYSHWIVQRGAEAGSVGAVQLDGVVQGLLAHVLDRNRRVQEAACSALATLEEEAGPEGLMPRLMPILETLARATLAYSRKNLRILYDALSTLAEAVGRPLGQAQYSCVFLPPLMAKWNATPDTDRELLPLLECFTAVAQALGPAFEEYAPTTFERCHRLVATQLQAQAAVAAGQPPEVEPEREFIVCALDLVSGMAEGLGSSLESLVGGSQLRNMLLQCCHSGSPDVQQSAFALVGDLAKACPAHLKPHADFFSVALQALDANTLRHENMSACNNACWSLGELAVKVGQEELQPLAVKIVEQLWPILAAPAGTMPRSILENSAITLGRVAWVAADALAPHLEIFVWHWCNVLRSIRDDIEKEHAFLGLCRLLRLNPKGALNAFDKVCEAVASWRTLQCEGLANEFTEIMQLYKTTLSAMGQWEPLMQRLDAPVRDKLVAMCHL